MKKAKRILAGLLASASVFSLAGCSGQVAGNDATRLPLVAPLTVGEVKEYYARSLDFDSVITRTVDPDVTKYELHPVENGSETSTKLIKAAKTTLVLLNSMEYTNNPDLYRYLDESTFHYIKAFLNDKEVYDMEIASIQEALGYYFVEIKGKVGPREPGTFTGISSLLGLNGAIIYHKEKDIDEVDDYYMEMAVKSLNDYYKENKITTKLASYDKATKVFSTDPTLPASGGLDFTETTATEPDTTSASDALDPIEGDTGTEGARDTTPAEGDQMESGDTTASGQVYTPFTPLKVRRPSVDVYEFNTIVGSSLRNSAYVPKLDMIYTKPTARAIGESTGTTISGMGIMPAGLGGLTTFGFDRSQLNGEITLNFIYKDELLDPSKVICTNIYPKFLDIKTGFSSNNDSVVPSFVEEEIVKLLERADRAMINNDTMALMSGTIFADMGMAVQVGYERQYSNVLRQMSVYRRTISRDLESNSYLVEVETQRQEGPKGPDVYGTYRDKNYVVIQQVGQEFVITDWFHIQRQLEVEPDIDPDSAVTKRLVALHLAGEVSDAEKQAAEELLQELYMASTYRKLYGPVEVQNENGETITLNRGMYDCFNSNVEMLSSEKNEIINSKLRERLVKEGTDRKAPMQGIVTQWIGGASNQVEFMTEELIAYRGMDKGIYMQCYYLISKMEDVWVIDDIQVVEEEVHEGAQLAADKERIGGLVANS